MSFGPFAFRRLQQIVPVVGLLIASAVPLVTEYSIASAQVGPALLVDDAATANPDLVEVEVADPAGFGVSGQTLQVPPGYAVSVVAAGLGGPRFMDFDDVGNLLVGAADDGVVYRVPFADGRLGESKVLIQGLQQPASVAIVTADDGQYLYVGEIHQVSRFPYNPAGPIGAQE